jgi:hypothetical protein
MKKQKETKKRISPGWFIMAILLFGSIGIVYATNYFNDAGVVTDGNITADYFIGDGSRLTNIGGGDSAILYVQANNGSDIQATINECQTTGCTVIIPTGIYNITNSIVPRNNLTLMGQGVGKTILYGNPKESGTPGSFIETLKTANSPLMNFRLEALEINGLEQDNSSYNSGIKGVYIQYMIKPVFKDLYIHDTVATCLGVDFLDGGLIDNVFVENCGTPGEIGSNGIGIGTNGWAREPLIITNSQAQFVANKGIMVEEQDEGLTANAQDVIISNSISLFNDDGFAISGTGETVLANVISANNTDNGLVVAATTFNNVGASRVIITGSQFNNNKDNGIYFSGSQNYSNPDISELIIDASIISQNRLEGIYADGSDIKISNSIIKGNNASGIELFRSKSSVIGNTISENKKQGIHVYSTNAAVNLTDILISDNMILDNGVGGATSSDDAIAIETSAANRNLKKIIISDNIITNTPNSIGSQGYAIRLSSGGSPSNITDSYIRNNYLKGNDEGAIADGLGALNVGLFTFGNIGVTTNQFGDGTQQYNMTLTSPDGTEYNCGVANGGTFSCA